MSTQLDREQINQLISEKRYDDAKNILRTSTDPSAKAWLDNLERQFPGASSSLPPLRSVQYGSGPARPGVYYTPKERGGCLTVWLILIVIVNPLLAIYYLSSGSNLTSLLHLPSWTIPVLIIFAIINTVCAFGIWEWKKWSGFGFIGSGIIVSIINLTTLGLNPSSIGGLVGLGLMWYLLQNRWQMFD